MCNIILKFSTNNIFLTVLINKIKVFSKSTGQFLEYQKGKQKISKFALIVLLNSFFNFYISNYTEKNIFKFIFLQVYGCTLKRFFFLKTNLNFLFEKIKYQNLILIDQSLFSFSGCRLKKKKRKKKKKKRVSLKIS